MMMEAVVYHQGAPVLNQFYPCLGRYHDPLGHQNK